MFATLRHFPFRHWQGQAPLLPTLVFTLLGLRLALGWATAQKPPDWPLLPFAALTAASAAILLWQVVGSLRAIRRDGTGPGLAAGLAAVTVAIALFTTAEFDGFAARAADSGGLPPPVPLPVSRNIVEVTGTLDWTLYRRFCSTLVRNPGLTLVSLESDGGLVPVGRAMALRISERGLDTQAAGLCASACALAFMGGTRRSLGPEGGLGFHGYLLYRYHPLQSLDEEEARDKAWLMARGVDPGFVARAYATPRDGLWRPDAATLRAAGVLTDTAPIPGAAAPLGCEDVPDHPADRP